MDMQVKLVAGLQSCYVSLPLSLIQALDSTSGGSLPPVLALELREILPGRRRWLLAWCGSASNSRSIEVERQYGECVGLPNLARVQVRVIGNLPKAGFVAVEPCTEDDWEILERNSEVAEEAMLKQVGIVHEGMKFPLWLRGHTIVRLLVESTSPKSAVVQLVPGTEVAVAPKKRKNHMDGAKDIQKKNPEREQPIARALLRVQEENKRDVHRFELEGAELGVVLTSVAFINPQTAQNLSVDNLQAVSIFPKPLQEIMSNSKDTGQRKGNSFRGTEENAGSSSNNREVLRHIVVHILYSESVAKGHIMLPQSLRFFLRADVHSWVYLKKYDINSHKNISSFRLSPFRFKRIQNIASWDRSKSNIHSSLSNSKNGRMNSSPSSASATDWSLHEKVFASTFRGFSGVNEEVPSPVPEMQENDFLLRAWLIGQLRAISSYANGVDVTSLILSKETLLQFELRKHNLSTKPQKEISFNDAIEDRSTGGECAAELLYLLVPNSEDSFQVNLDSCYELALNTQLTSTKNVHEFQMKQSKVELGEPISIDSIEESNVGGKYMKLSSMSWMEAAISDVSKRFTVLLSPCSRKLLSSFDLPLPGHVLIYGPHGSGKTSLAMAVSKSFEEDGDILAHIVFVNCSKLESEKSQAMRQTIANCISEALTHSPSIIILDDLDHIISQSSEFEGAQVTKPSTTLANFFIDLMDEYREKSLSSCGHGPIAFVATVQALENLPHSLTSAGRFDFHVHLPAPSVSERGAIMKNEVYRRRLQCNQDIILDVASKCEGYDAYDLEVLVDRTVHAAIHRYMVPIGAEPSNPSLLKEDFSKAMQGFAPVSMRGLTKIASEGGHSGWEDVGGLRDIRNAIKEMIELPSKFPDIFAQSPLRLRSNVLLYGPPGCGKTHIVGAVAAACSLRFISVKGPELLNKYIGASEQAVRDLFAKAASAAPCLLFFDEFDSIAPKRGHDNTGVTDRVVNQLLTELDGVEALRGVFVFAATSRPDLLDAALLRPGRLDRLLFCDFPSLHDRLDILRVLSRKLSLASDVEMETIASMTEGFSGADLQALLSDAQLASVHELLDSGDSIKSRNMPIITNELLKSVASKARASVSEAEKRRLNGIYSQFLDLKKSVMAQSRDAKGKRATLA